LRDTASKTKWSKLTNGHAAVCFRCFLFLNQSCSPAETSKSREPISIRGRFSDCVTRTNATGRSQS
jgi:hypothetical protein